MLTCPHCGKRGVSTVRKLFVGPLFSNPCTICGKRWAISQWSVAVAVGGVMPYLVFMVIAQPSRFVAGVVGLAILVALGAVIVYFVPVVRR